jgi:YesN/AraC family two-component response regulator
MVERFIEMGIFLNPDLNLQKAATQLDIPKYKLTQFVQEEGYGSFYSFVNFYRVEKKQRAAFMHPRL